MKNGGGAELSTPFTRSRRNAVWKALTDPKALSRWFLPGDFEPRMGFRFQFEMGRPKLVQGEVIAADREKRLAYKWQARRRAGVRGDVDAGATPVGGTHVHLEHTEAASGATMSGAWSWGHVVARALPRMLAAGAGRAA